MKNLITATVVLGGDLYQKLPRCLLLKAKNNVILSNSWGTVFTSVIVDISGSISLAVR